MNLHNIEIEKPISKNTTQYYWVGSETLCSVCHEEDISSAHHECARQYFNVSQDILYCECQSCDFAYIDDHYYVEYINYYDSTLRCEPCRDNNHPAYLENNINEPA